MFHTFHRLFVIAALVCCGGGAIAQLDRSEVIGLITDRASGGFWAKFDRPVAQGGSVRIRVSPDGADVSEAQVLWASNVPPYEAYLVNVNPDRKRPGVTYRTPYQDLFREQALRMAVDRGDRITPGYYVTANPGTPAKVNDVLRGLMDLIDVRQEFREHLRRAGREHVDWPDLHMILDQRSRIWTDPITDRLAKNIRELLMERNNVQGTVPASWFPAEEARKKTETQPNR